MDYGMGNIHSMIKALELYHNDVIFTADPDELRKADALVLPGDGAFAAAMDHLAGEKGEILKEHVNAGRPLLGVCIGFQALFEDSDEVPRDSSEKTIKGLGLIPGKVRRFRFEDPDLRVPHMGWNRLVDCKGAALDFRNEYMYFIHSYRAEATPEEYVLANAEYGGEHFPAFVQKDNILAAQFHPEKSHTRGLALIENWIKTI